MGKFSLELLGVFAEIKTNFRKERQAEGIAKVKYPGCKPSIDPVKVRELKNGAMGATKIAKELDISRVSIYRALNAHISDYDVIEDEPGLNR